MPYFIGRKWLREKKYEATFNADWLLNDCANFLCLQTAIYFLCLYFILLLVAENNQQ